MSGVWIKIAIFAILVVGVIVGISVLSPGEKPGPQGPQNYAEQVAEDRAKFEIDYENQSLPEQQPAKPAPQEPAEQPQTPPAAAQPPAVQQPAPKPVKFVELEDIEDQVSAERLYQQALTQRSMGRLPGVGKYRRMVQFCRQIIKQYPGTVYAYRAKQMMADIPHSYQEDLGVTAEELDLSEFTE